MIDDEEEYAVLAAVLFPHEPEVPDGMENDLQRKTYLSMNTVRLSGFHGSQYTLEDKTITARMAEKTDASMAEDYNKKNGETCSIDGGRLLTRVPAGKNITLVSTKEMKKTFSSGGRGWEEFRQRRPLAGGITRLSRPGFSSDRTQAVVEARHQADYEMGVGYRVYLDKSKKTGKWIITGADMTRRS